MQPPDPVGQDDPQRSDGDAGGAADELGAPVRSLLERINTLRGADALEGYMLEVAAAARSLLAAGMEPLSIARVIASLNGALTRRLLRLAEEELGPPPCPYAWLALGSEGRMEQVLATDQDNALVYRDDAAPAHEYFAALADWAGSALLRAGFPPCPGGYMASRQRRPLAEWEQAFRRWVETPEPQALLEAEVFMDFRVLHGELSAQPLDDVLLAGAGRPMFLFHLARAALRFRPPLGLWGRVSADNGELDLKRGGLAAIVLIARVSALAARSTARGTVDRLEAAAAGGTLSHATAEDLSDAFAFLMRLRLRAQLRRLDAGEEPGNAVALASLSALEQRRLSEALRTVKDAQQGVQVRYRAYVGE